MSSTTRPIYIYISNGTDVYVCLVSGSSLLHIKAILLNIHEMVLSSFVDVFISTIFTPCFPYNSLRPRQNGRLFADDTLKHIFLNEKVRISIKNSLKFVPKGPNNNIPALVQIMAWRRSGDKALSEPMMVSLPTHICVTRLQWVKNSCIMRRQGGHTTV